MFFIFTADNHNLTITFDDTALVTHWFYAWSYFHFYLHAAKPHNITPEPVRIPIKMNVIQLRL
jgi:hypothetical protein